MSQVGRCGMTAMFLESVVERAPRSLMVRRGHASLIRGLMVRQAHHEQVFLFHSKMVESPFGGINLRSRRIGVMEI